MNLLKKIFLVLIFIFQFSNSFGAMVTHVQTGTFEDDHQESDGKRDGIIAGIEFNKDGTKMFTSFGWDPLSPADDYHMINEYNLSTPYDISTKTYAGTTERCELGNGTDGVDFWKSLKHLFFSDKKKIKKILLLPENIYNKQTSCKRCG